MIILIIITLIVIGLAWYLPLPAPILDLIRVIIIVGIFIWLLSLFFGFQLGNGVPGYRI
jgi:hypothetical protein